MKTDLDHLPAGKREQIQRVAELVRDGAPVEMLVLFGSYARGDWVDDQVNAYFSDYDFLVVVATEELAEDLGRWERLTTEVRKLTGRALVSLIVHDVRQINQEIRVGQYFFSEIVSQGILLHDTGRFTLAQPKALTARERRQLAERSFRYWFESASGFWRISGHCAARALLPHAAFLLHQATERYFHAALLVYTGYKPKTHDIKTLAEQTAPLHPALAGALPRIDPEDERLFDLLKRAYIDARYSPGYRITQDELRALQDRVLDLARRVLEACADQLAAIGGGEAVAELPALPAFEDAIELPEPPRLDDPKALAAWRDAVAAVAYDRGERLREEGRTEGRGEGREEGRFEERALAIVDVLHRRNVHLGAADSDRILACRDAAALARWWDRAWHVTSAAELFEPD
jgi:predicted nucleotidyltransferase/HEPN domain-containing protein